MIPEKPTWQIHDSSKCDTWLDCPRLYFFEHVLGWRMDKPAHDLYFGECWHRAREFQLINGYQDVVGAYSAFIDHYRLEFSQESDAIYTPKDPTAVAMALSQFADERQSDLEENEVLYTETSGTVPISDTQKLYYRMDSVMRRLTDGMIFSWDHKSRKSYFNRQWTEKFFLSVQNGTYTHCLYCMYPVEKVLGIEFCGTAFKYAKRAQAYTIEFQRVSAWKSPEQMNVWLWQVLDILDSIEHEFDRLSHCKEDDAVMMCFPMNTNSCTKYYGCIFHDYCMSWPNPLQRYHEPPLGFKEEFWNPSEIKTTNKLDLEWR